MEDHGRLIIEEILILPEEVTQHIQSFMNAKEAARSTLLSKSWYTAWLTRPMLDFDNRYLKRQELFEQFTEKTMKRYGDLGFKIDSLRLNLCSMYVTSYKAFSRELIVRAMETGAVNLKLVFPSKRYEDDPFYTLPQEVLGSKTLLRLSLRNCEIDGDYVITSSRLKSLSLRNVTITNNGSSWYKDRIISCRDSLEKLKLSWCDDVLLSRENLYELRNLRRLFLDSVDVDTLFFDDFASRFPCLKDLAIIHCRGWTRIEISSTSLETIRFETRESWRAAFDAPNIRKFTYFGSGIPSNSLIKGGSRKWELDIIINCKRLNDDSWFLSLKRLLTKFSPSSIISLHIILDEFYWRRSRPKHKVVDTEPVVVVENLTVTIDETGSSLCCALMNRLLRICRPKFVNKLIMLG